MRVLQLLVLAYTLLTAVSNAAPIAFADQSVTLGVVVDAAQNPTLLNISGTDLITHTPSGDVAALTDGGASFPNSSLVGTDGVSQLLVLAFDLAAFNGSTIGFTGTPATSITNQALLALLGVHSANLRFNGSVPLGEGSVLSYSITGIDEPVSTLPEPATGAVVAAGLVVLLWKSRRVRGARA